MPRRLDSVEVEREDDGRWLAEVPDLPGVLAYGDTEAEAVERVQMLALRVLADRAKYGEPTPRSLSHCRPGRRGC